MVEIEPKKPIPSPYFSQTPGLSETWVDIKFAEFSCAAAEALKSLPTPSDPIPRERLQECIELKPILTKVPRKEDDDDDGDWQNLSNEDADEEWMDGEDEEMRDSQEIEELRKLARFPWFLHFTAATRVACIRRYRALR
ncbi:hypothetical protein L873DRAFT_1793750 [Choiromyces venosus 120613-1]|uniref:Uncharacterized protein n=1 Tax=Choiromyces venosus 120613-1 TaxID=1336337 RepID=A0A3N4J7S1_9PEZI|nr:hypothetical protein L873DRAFT_1793750 [Choiromyces venosus 120613-1]